jgi:hypothetical protein
MPRPIALLPCLALLAALLPLAPPRAHAVVLIGNLGAIESTIGSGVGPSPNPQIFQEFAVSFTLPNSSFEIINAILRFGDQDALDGAPQIVLRADSGGLPGSPLTTFIGPTPTQTAAATYTFTPVDSIPLAANTTYWLQVGQSGSSGDYAWIQSDPASDPAGLATFGSYRRSSDNGATWPSLSANRFKFELNALSLPEPSAALLFLLATLPLATRRQR